jgi:ABC-type antimicrobial peptide transport system permease subunit
MPGNPLTDPNWANEVTDQITTLVGTVREKTTNNAIVVVRAVVFGLLGAILGLVLVTLLLVLLTRLIQAILSNWIDWDTAVYVSYFIIGGLLTLAGAFLMTKRHS